MPFHGYKKPHTCDCGKPATQKRCAYWVCDRCGELETRGRQLPPKQTEEVKYSTEFYRVAIPGYAR